MKTRFVGPRRAHRHTLRLAGRFAGSWLLLFLLPSWAAAGPSVPVDQSGWDKHSRIKLDVTDTTLTLRWPMRDSPAGGPQTWGELTLNRTADLSEQPLIRRIGVAVGENAPFAAVLEHVNPATYLTVGTRKGREQMSGADWSVFFDRVHERPYETFRAELRPTQYTVSSTETRATLTIDGMQAGSFSGRFQFTVYGGCDLVRAEAVLSTHEDRRAIYYDAGLVGTGDSTWQRLAWRTTGGPFERTPVSAARQANEPTHLAVKHRTVLAESENGTVALFPPPHQFFYPLDLSTNLQYVWYGRNFHGQTPEFGLGIRHHPEGDRRFVPWFNAPPGTQQRLSLFYLLSPAAAEDTLQSVLEYTHGDRYPALDGHKRFTSHYHFAHAADVLNRREEGLPADEVPSFVQILKELGVDVVHLAEFHGDGHPQDDGELRLLEMHTMHEECARLSDDELLVLPGEEPNVHFGGHWIIFFPRPVYWIMSRNADQPFVEEHPRYGTVYRTGSAAELLEMLRREKGLAWTAHPRIKSSFGYPDRHRQTEFFRSDRFLGAAWKAMPADLSRPKLGERVLVLLDDMANWGDRKYVLGEVDVFKIDPTHELYAHMNMNYLRMDQLPRFEEGWDSILRTMRDGKFFVSTGEVMLPHVSVDGKQSGESLTVSTSEPARHTLRAEMQWTFPLSFAEVVSGDGETVHRERIDLSRTGAFGRQTLETTVDLSNRTWVRFEVWDIAANGAFTQPIWIERGE